MKALEERLGTTLSRPELGLTALTHKSWINEHRGEGFQDNERLEFLGDAVLNLAVGHRLMERFPQMKEGELTPLRARIVNEEGLSRIARRLGLGELLQLGRGEELSGGREKSSLLANALEAVFAAVYLGSGLEPVMGLVDRHFSRGAGGGGAGAQPAGLQDEAAGGGAGAAQADAPLSDRLRGGPRPREDLRGGGGAGHGGVRARHRPQQEGRGADGRPRGPGCCWTGGRSPGRRIPDNPWGLQGTAEQAPAPVPGPKDDTPA